jgi:ABC-2 type transport system permease protein
LRSPYQSLARDYWFGRLETILLSPCPVWLAVLADVGWIYSRTLLNVFFYALLGWAFGARIEAGLPNLLAAVLALGIASIAVLGFGFMSAAMFMLINAKGWNDPVAWLIGIFQGLITGVYFPIQLLPSGLYHLALLFPQTYALDAARRLLLPAADWPPLPIHSVLPPVQADFVVLIVLAVIFSALGAVLFTAGITKAKRDGGLSRWT